MDRQELEFSLHTYLAATKGTPTTKISNAQDDWLAIAGRVTSKPHDQLHETSKIVRSLLKFHT